MPTHPHKSHSVGSSSIPSTASKPSAHPQQNGAAQALKYLDQIEQLLGNTLKPLNANARRRMPKMRPDGDKFALAMARLAATSSVLSGFPLAPVALEESVQASQSLAPLADRLRALSRLLDDTLLLEKSTAWSHALKIYRMVQTAAEHDAALAAELAPWEQFFRRVRHRVKGNGAAGSSAPSTP